MRYFPSQYKGGGILNSSLTSNTSNPLSNQLHSLVTASPTGLEAHNDTSNPLSNQAGVSDCALFAMDNLTHLALGKDPTKVIFNQDELRSHLITILKTGNVTAFPVQEGNQEGRLAQSKLK